MGELNILMISHHRRSRAWARPLPMARHLIERGHNVLLLVTSDERRFGLVTSDWDGVPVVESPDLLWDRLRSGWDIWNLLNRVRFLAHSPISFDLVHCFETRPATIYPALYYCRRFRVPLITDWQDWFGRGGIIDVLRPRWYRHLFGWLETYYEEKFRTRGAGLTVISSGLEQRAIGLGVDPARICRITGGAFPERLLAGGQAECRKRVGFPLNGPVLGFSSLDSHLDLDLVMQALAQVAKRFPTVKLIITGKAGEAVTDLARRHGVENHVVLTGFLSEKELPWYLGCADVFVLPFPDEAYNIGRWPNKLGDYLCLARPIVSNPYGDIKPFFESHEIGLLAAWDPLDFAEKIITLIENPGLAARLGRNARCVSVSELDWRVLSERLEAFYLHVLGLEGAQIDRPRARSLPNDGEFIGKESR